MTDPKRDIEALYALVVKDAAKDKVSLQDRIEALKVLKPYYELLAKKRDRVEAEPSAGPTFGDFRADLQESEDQANGRTALRGGGRRN